MQSVKRTLAEAKVFNLKLLEKKRFQVWKLQGVSFKLFKNKQEIIQYSSTFDCFDRIDLAIKSEVDEIMAEANEVPSPAKTPSKK